MTLPAGVHLGPYEVRGLIGRGGMGEVYRAWDARLEREVAVKVLPGMAAADADRLRRFELEAKATGALNHANVVAVYDVGTHDGVPYVVTERLSGQTLHACMLSPEGLTARKAVELAAQIARGLAAAHEHGIVHRDLKPRNLFLCLDGTVKILDFGLAKLLGKDEVGPDGETTSPTRPGAIVGTCPYMSPEQVKGQVVDPRSDIFSLGIVLYEMLAGERPFRGDTRADVHAAILREDPRDLSTIDRALPSALVRLVRRCLEKRPEDRFDTAHDVALALEALTDAAGAPTHPAPARGWPRPQVAAAMAGAILAGVGLGAFMASRLRSPLPPPSYAQLTFRRGTIVSARFVPDGDTVVYSAAWDGGKTRVFTTRPGSRESRDLGLEGDVLAVSARGEMAIRIDSDSGILARASLSGGAPRQLVRGVRDADWDPEGRHLAIVRQVAGQTRLEYPIGRVVYVPEGQITGLRMLPTGAIAVIERVPNGGVRPFTVSLIDPVGGRTTLSPGWAECFSLSWSPVTGEILFPGSAGGEYALQAVSAAGHGRLVARVPGDFLLHDVDRSGRMLLVRSFPRAGIQVLAPGATREHDLSWLDFSFAADLSADGRRLLIGDIGGGLGGRGGISLRETDGSPAVFLSEGSPLSLSPDARLVLGLPDVTGPGRGLLVIPTGPGERHELRHSSVPQIASAAWLPDGKRIVIVGGREDAGTRLYAWDIEAAEPPRAISPEGLHGPPVVAPDGRWVTARDGDMPLMLYPVEGGPPRPLRGARGDDWPVRWSADGRSLFVRRGHETPARIESLDIVSGDRLPWKELGPPDPAGLLRVGALVMTPDGAAYAYTFVSSLDTLYLAEGIR